MILRASEKGKRGHFSARNELVQKGILLLLFLSNQLSPKSSVGRCSFVLLILSSLEWNTDWVTEHSDGWLAG